MLQSKLLHPLKAIAGLFAVAATFYLGSLLGKAINSPSGPTAVRLEAADPTPRPPQVEPENTANPWSAEVRPAPPAEVVAPAPLPTLAVEPLPRPPAHDAPRARLDPMPVATAALERLKRARSPRAAAVAEAHAAVRSGDGFAPWLALATALTAAGELAAAVPALEHVLTKSTRIEETGLRAQAASLLAEIDERLGDLDRMAEDAVRAVELARESGRPAELAVNLARIAEHQLRTGNANGAEGLLLEARAAAFAASDPKLGLRLQMRVAGLARARGDLAKAQALIESGIKTSYALKLGEEQADHYAELGHIYAARNEKDEALAHWRSARDQYEQLGLKPKVAQMAALLKGSAPTEAAPSEPAPKQAAPRKPVKTPARLRTP